MRFPTSHLLGSLLCCFLLAPTLRAQVAATGGQERGPNAPAPLPLTTWRELTDHPGRYTNQHLRLVLQFQSRVETWNPYLTRFGTRDFDAFQFWGDEQRLWVLSDYQSPGVRLFARKRSTADWALEAARPYTRFEVEISVRDVFLDQPWAEIERVTRLDEHLSEGTLIHASRAIDLIQNKSWKLAENELDQALVGLLPTESKRELEALRDGCRQMAAPRGGAEPKPTPVLRGKRPPVQPQN